MQRARSLLPPDDRELPLHLIVREERLLAQVHPYLSLEVADALFLGELVGTNPAAKGSQVRNPGGDVNGLVVEDDRVHGLVRIVATRNGATRDRS